MSDTFDFNSELGSMPEDTLNALFEDGAPEGTPNAGDLKIGKELDETTVPELGEEDLFEDDTKTPEEIAAAKKVADDKKIADKAKIDEDKAKAEKEKADKLKTPEQLAKEKEETEAAEKVKAEKAKLDETANSPEVQEVLTNTVDYLVKQGVWIDFEGREDLKVTPEIYQQLVEEQDKLRLASQFDELVDSTGDYGKAIIAHIKQGGNPDEVIDIFKEQKALEALPTGEETDKQVVIEKYYKDVLGWNDTKVAKQIKRIIAEDGVEDEFKEVKDLYDKHFKEQLANLDREAKAVEARKTEQKEIFKNNIKAALQKEDTLTPQERKLVEESILNFKHDIGGGQKVNDFYIAFSEMQKDPAKYIHLVRFVMDPDNYARAIKTKAESTVAKQTFQFIKGAAAVSKSAGGTATKTTPAVKGSATGTNFQFK